MSETGDRAPEAGPGAPDFGIVLSGGLALGAYQGGLFSALAEAGRWPARVAGTSTGALNAAVALGGPVETAAERLRQLWFAPADPFGMGLGALSSLLPETGPRVASALETLSLGRAGLFRPRLPPLLFVDADAGHLSLDPLRRRLGSLVDFDQLNAGPVQLQVTATDLETGEQVVFDTGRSDRIGPDEVVAACAMPPLFAPVEHEGRLLGDGGLTANTPVADALRNGLPTMVVDLLPRAGERPGSLSEGASRAASIAFASQTWTLLDGARERHALERRLAGLGAAADPLPVRLVMVNYSVEGEEPGATRLFDYRAKALERRWTAGEDAARRALARLDAGWAEPFAVEAC